MTAPEIREEELHAFVDSQLPKGRCTAVLAYLGQHPQEIARLAAYAAQKEEIRRQLDAIDLPSDNATTAALQRAVAERLRGRSYEQGLRRVAAMVALLAVGWWANTIHGQYFVDRLPGVVIEAAQAHQIFSRDSDRPVELTAAAAADMEAWFSSRLGELVEIPSLNALGLQLVGGRLLAGDNGPVAQLIYEGENSYRLTLGLSAELVDIGPEIEVVTFGGLKAGYWHEGELTYALVGPETDQELIAIATQLGAELPRSSL
jgi:anti-sigma factor RsiW